MYKAVLRSRDNFGRLRLRGYALTPVPKKKTLRLQLRIPTIRQIRHLTVGTKPYVREIRAMFSTKHWVVKAL